MEGMHKDCVTYGMIGIAVMVIGVALQYCQYNKTKKKENDILKLSMAS